jgi:hypothetical protein
MGIKTNQQVLFWKKNLGEKGGGDVLKLLPDDFHGSSWFNVSRSSFPLFLLSRLHYVALL